MLHQSYGATQQDDAPFLQRVTQWQRDKEKEAAARKVDGEVNKIYKTKKKGYRYALKTYHCNGIPGMQYLVVSKGCTNGVNKLGNEENKTKTNDIYSKKYKRRSRNV